MILNSKTEKVSSVIRNKKRVPTLTICIQHGSGSPSQRNPAKKEIKGIRTRKENVKFLCFQIT